MTGQSSNKLLRLLQVTIENEASPIGDGQGERGHTIGIREVTDRIEGRANSDDDEEREMGMTMTARV